MERVKLLERVIEAAEKHEDIYALDLQRESEELDASHLKTAELAAAIAPHTVIPIHYGKLLGGANAAERFRAALDSRIEADIRPTAFSTVMISMYLRIAVLIPLCCVLGYFIGKML